MDSQPRQQRLRPQIYVRIEFGLSWSQQHPKNHEITYKSRRLRESPSSFPRRVPAPNTNFLALPPSQTRQDPMRAPAHHQDEPPHVGLGISQEPYSDYPPDQRRPRAESISSHERRRSAPPPFGDNPWDVAVARRQSPVLQPAPLPNASASASASASRPANRPAPELWKSLPEVPSRFRLGEEGMPWSLWDPSIGYEPSAYPREDDAAGPVQAVPDFAPEGLYDATPRPSHAPAISIASPTSPVPEFPPEDPEKSRNLEALSAAMMTVDNGFEDQWWYQGARESTMTSHPPPPSPVPNPQALSPQRSLGWAVASTPVRHDRSPSHDMADLVSPVSDSASAIDPPTFCSLTRTLTTRSEELFLY